MVKRSLAAVLHMRVFNELISFIKSTIQKLQKCLVIKTALLKTTNDEYMSLSKTIQKHQTSEKNQI